MENLKYLHQKQGGGAGWGGTKLSTPESQPLTGYVILPNGTPEALCVPLSPRKWRLLFGYKFSGPKPDVILIPDPPQEATGFAP